MESYAFNLSRFWVRIFNLPFECIYSRIAMDVGGATREDRGNWKNEIEVIEAKRIVESELKGKTQGNTKLNVPGKTKEREKTKLTKEESGSRFQVEKRSLKLSSETCGKLSNKKKRARGNSRELIEDSPSRTICRKLMDGLSPFKATAGD
ncbi:hypothetical protein Golob_000966 [Gossypium lobatum]|uniref:DUF4283 domain-containing protein n=1 Tax=Gossypium lobatum TaxID=34289 RepID=A0A7J8NA18_9ROSI|nr:hypothetical protein [Gossypium lobatum]